MKELNHSPLDKLDNYKENNYEYKRIQLTSPLLHIGVGETGALNIFEYIQENGNIYFPNLTALVEALHNPENLQKSKAIQKARKPRESRSEFLKQFEQLSQKYIHVIETKPADQVKQIDKILSELKRLYDQALGKNWLDNEEIIPDEGISEKCVDRLITDPIAPMIRNGFGEIYIPGSSTKGAIRTAIAYYLLRYQVSTKFSAIEQKLRSIAEQKMAENKKKFLDDNLFLKGKISLNNYLFSNFTFRHQEQTFGQGKINTPNTDLMRAIKIQDSSPIYVDYRQKINLLIVVEVLTSSLYENVENRTIKLHRFSKYLEMIENLQTEFYIFVDTAMLDCFHREQGVEIPEKLRTVKGILEICQEFAQHQWEHEQRYWSSITDSPSPNLNFSSVRQFYTNPCSYNLRLGSGSGMTGTTVDLLFQEATRAKIRDACGKPTNSTETPKSRRTALIPNQGNPIKQPLGWVNLTVI